MSTRSRVNFSAGVASGISSTSQTVISGTTWPVPSGGYTGSNYVPVVLNPGYFGASNQQEIIYITNVVSSGGGTNNVATVTRNQEGSPTTVTGTTVNWVAGPLVADFDVSNLTSTGTLTLNNGLISSTISGSAVFATYTVSGQNIIAGQNASVGSLAVSGSTTIGGTTSISGNLVVTSGVTVTGTTTTGGLLVTGNITTGYGNYQQGYVPGILVANLAYGSVPASPNWLLCSFSTVINPSGSANTFITFPTAVYNVVTAAYGYPVINIGSASDAVVAEANSYQFNGFYCNFYNSSGGYFSGSIRVDVMVLVC